MRTADVGRTAPARLPAWEIIAGTSLRRDGCDYIERVARAVKLNEWMSQCRRGS